MTGDQRAEIAQQLIARVHNFSDLDQGLRRSRLSRTRRHIDFPPGVPTLTP